MLLLMPYSTDVHDGRIRMGAVVIMALCLVVHLLVMADNSRVSRMIGERIAEFQRPSQLHEEAVNQLPDSPEELQAFMERFQASQEALRDSMERSLREVVEGGLLHRLGVVPARLSIPTLLTYMFVHGGWIHLLGNLLFFYVCGVAMEKYWGLWRFVGAYLGCGVFAALVYLLTTMFAPPAVRVMPLVGASGAIAGAMGAFVVTHAKVRVKLFYLALWIRGTLRIPSPVYFGLWFAGQIASALLEPDQSSGIAYTAHVGGFVLGVVLGRFLKSEDDDALVVPVQVMRAIERGGAPRVVQSSAVAGQAAPPAALAAAPAWGGPAAFLSAGREALDKGDTRLAAQCLSRAMEMLVREPAVRRLEVAEAVTLLSAGAGALGIPAAQYYHWGKALAQARLAAAAVALLDRAAASADTPHLRKSSLLAAAELRIGSGFQADRAADDLRTVISLDGDGLCAQQARRMLAGISTPPGA